MQTVQTTIKKLIFFKLATYCCDTRDEFNSFTRASRKALKTLAWKMLDLDGHLDDETRCYTPDMQFTLYQAAIIELSIHRCKNKLLLPRITLARASAFEQLNFRNQMHFHEFVLLQARTFYNEDVHQKLAHPTKKVRRQGALTQPSPRLVRVAPITTYPSFADALCDAIQGGTGPCRWS